MTWVSQGDGDGDRWGGKGGNRVDSRFGVRGSDKKAKQEEKRWVHHRAEEFRYC